MITGTVGGTTLRAEELEAAEAWCTGMVNRAACLMVMLHATGTTHENHLINQREVQWCIVYMYMYGIV